MRGCRLFGIPFSSSIPNNQYYTTKRLDKEQKTKNGIILGL